MNWKINLFTKRWIALLLVFTLTIGLLHIQASFVSQASVPDIRNPRTVDEVTTWDCVYFGNYWQNDTNGDGKADQSDKKEPIKWRVLSVDGNDAFLLADIVLDGQNYHEINTGITWEKCTVRTWLNNTFLLNTFNEAEQAAIKTTYNINADNPYSGNYGGNNTDDSIFLLSIDEVCNDLYGFVKSYDNTTETRYVKPSAYAIEQGAMVWSDLDEYCRWWLRSAGYYDNSAAAVRSDGSGYRKSHPVWDCSYGIRPALHLDLSQTDVWSYAGEVTARNRESSSNPTSTPNSSKQPIITDASTTTTKETGASLSIGGNKSGNASGKVGKFFPGDWKMASADYPVEISKTTDVKNGSYKIKIAIGIGRSDILDDETQWNKLKKNLKEANKNLTSYVKQLKAKKKTVVGTKGFKGAPEVSIIGYFEEEYDKYGNVISSTGKVAADASWKASTTWSFATPIGPMYLKLQGGAKVSGDLGPKYNYTEKKWKFVDGSLTIKPNISLEGGYGVDKVATIGAKGSAELPVQVVPFSNASFNASASVHVYVIFLLDTEYTLAKCSIPLWGTKKSNSLSPYSLEQVGDTKVLDTSFSKFTSEWQGTVADSVKRNASNRKKLSSGFQEEEETANVLQEGILTTSLPIIEEIDGKKVMIFQALDTSRDILNASVLKYSVCEDGIWSEPKAILDDGKSDLYADMKVVNGTLAVTWQKEKKEFGSELEEDATEALEEMAVNSEIYYSQFDPTSNSFRNTVALTDNQTADMMPQICEDSDAITVTWVRNGDNSLMQESGINTIYMRSWNGSGFSNEKKMCETEQSINKYVAGQSGSSLNVYYVSQDEDENAVLYGQGGEVISEIDAAEDVITGISSLQFKDGKVAYIANGTLYQYDTKNTDTTTNLAGVSTFGNEAVYCSNGEKAGYVWSVYDSETDKGSIQASLKTEDGYSDPVTLFESDHTMYRSISPVLSENGSWNILANIQNTQTELNSLVYLTKDEDINLALDYARIDENDVDEDGLTGVDYFVTNTEDTPIDTIVLTVELEDGPVIRKKVEKTILPGEEIMGTEYLDLSQVTEGQTVKLSVYAKDQTSVSNNSVTNRIGIPDVEVKGNIDDQGNTAEITVILKNRSDKQAHLNLNISENNTVLMTKSDISLTENGEKQVVLTVPKSKITYNANGAAYLSVKADVLEGDYNEDNNEDYVILYQAEKDKSDNSSNKNFSGGSKKGGTVTYSPKAAKKISVARVTIKSAKNKKSRKVMLAWKKVRGAKGYQIQYATNKKFKKKRSKFTKKRKFTIKKLKKRKTYYFRVRAYKRNGAKKVYGKWSKVKKVKIRL